MGDTHIHPSYSTSVDECFKIKLKKKLYFHSCLGTVQITRTEKLFCSGLKQTNKEASKQNRKYQTSFDRQEAE